MNSFYKSFDYRAWPRDFDVRSSVAEQQELINDIFANMMPPKKDQFKDEKCRCSLTPNFEALLRLRAKDDAHRLNGDIYTFKQE
ncbi:MAG: hypothetical protein HWE39_09660 [Oceanospirillaceae bacterium]|nr:hypothetical protein [Oceanospirillaceae bacterium]